MNHVESVIGSVVSSNPSSLGLESPRFLSYQLWKPQGAQVYAFLRISDRKTSSLRVQNCSIKTWICSIYGGSSKLSKPWDSVTFPSIFATPTHLQRTVPPIPLVPDAPRVPLGATRRSGGGWPMAMGNPNSWMVFVVGIFSHQEWLMLVVWMPFFELSHEYWVSIIIPIDELHHFSAWGGPTTNQWLIMVFKSWLIFWLISWYDVRWLPWMEKTSSSKHHWRPKKTIWMVAVRVFSPNRKGWWHFV